MGHLHKYDSKKDQMTNRTDVVRRIVQYEAQNSMSIGNLAIVFGPTLFPATAPHGVNGQDGLVGATIQNKVRQTPPRRGVSQCWSFFLGD
jgi:RhoGAP domain